ncbi:hypothetical protein BGZ94_004151 [Podila epigama]|nr:hypothetical protein BGZ94_004151 [Podila epigama]
MLVNAAAQNHFKLDRFDQTPAESFDSLAPLNTGIPMRKSPTNYHRRTVSCLAVASHHEHYEHPSYIAPTGRYYDAVVFSEATSASPVHNTTRHAQRKSEGSISLSQLQQSLANAGVTNVIATAPGVKDTNTNSATPAGGSGLLGGKLVKPCSLQSLPTVPPAFHPHNYRIFPSTLK